MLIPQFSIRSLFGIVTIAAVFFGAVSFAIRGNAWAIAVTGVGVAMIVVGSVGAAVFLVQWVVSAMLAGFEPKNERSPFAQHTAPPQLVSPQEDLDTT